MTPLLSEEEIDAMDSGDDSDHYFISMEMFEKFVTEVSLIRMLIKENPVIKYVIVLSKDNRNLKARENLRKTWVKVYKRYLRLL